MRLVNLISVLLFMFVIDVGYSQFDTTFYFMPDVCRKSHLQTPYTNAEVICRCKDSLGRNAYDLDQIQRCRYELRYFSSRYKRDSTFLSPSLIETHEIAVLIRLNETRWQKIDFNFSHDTAGVYFLEQAEPIQVTDSDTMWSIKETPEDTEAVFITKYIKLDWAK